MRLLGLDFETTGLDTSNDRITEVGLAVWDTAETSPRITANAFMYDQGMEIKFTEETNSMMERVCGITPALLREVGDTPAQVLLWVEHMLSRHKIDFIVAHNGTNFDKPLLFSELKRHGVQAMKLATLPWIDTRTDISYAVEPSSKKLVHLCLDAGFMNPFPHRALFDVVSMLKMLLTHDVNKVAEESKLPWLTIRAVVAYEDREKAKAARFSWEKIGDISVPKCWIKRIKENQLEKERAACAFQIVVI